MKNAIKTILVFTGLISVGAFAQDVGIKLTSFYLTDPSINSRNAEICGTVTGNFSANHRVTVEVDPGPKSGKYNALPAQDGRFCMMVQTNSGRAVGSVYQVGQASNLELPSAEISVQK